MEEAITKKPILRATIVSPKPCLSCQFGIFDIPTDGKLNCFEAGASNIKVLTREEVENMAYCDKMVGWTNMELSPKDVKEDAELKAADKLLRNR